MGSPSSLLNFWSPIRCNLDCFSITLQIAIIYQAWNARNNKVHGKSYLTPRLISLNILNSLQGILLNSNCRNWGTIHPLGSSSSWHPPPDSWLKANFDGSFIANEAAAIGVVIRDHNGALVKAYGKRVIATSPLDCEIAAAASLEDIFDEVVLEAKGIILEGDSINA